MYDVLVREKRTQICLPLYIDSRNGSGLYILGKDCLSEKALKDAADKWEKVWHKVKMKPFDCHFCCLSWSEIRDYELEECSDIAELPVSFDVRAYGDDIEVAVKECQVVFENYDAYSGYNGEVPKGLDENYRKYFDDIFADKEDADDEVEDISVERLRKQRGMELMKDFMARKR